MHEDINTTIAENVGLIYKQLGKFNLVKDQEAESIGYGALHNAVLTYDETKGIKFSTYGSVCIYNALGCYVRTQNKQRQLEVLSYNNTNATGDEFVDFFAASDDTEAVYIRSELHALVRKVFDEELALLKNIRYVEIIEQWRELDYSVTTVELAKLTGNSQPYVSQALSVFRFKLKQRLEGYYNG